MLHAEARHPDALGVTGEVAVPGEDVSRGRGLEGRGRGRVAQQDAVGVAHELVLTGLVLEAGIRDRGTLGDRRVGRVDLVHLEELLDEVFAHNALLGVLDAVDDRRVVQQRLLHVGTHDHRVVLEAGVLQGLDLQVGEQADRIGGGEVEAQAGSVGTGGGQVDVLVPDALAEERSRPVDVTLQQELVGDEGGGIGVELEHRVRVRAHLVVDVLVDGVDVREVAIGIDVPVDAHGLGAGSTTLDVGSTPVGLGVAVVHVGLVLHRDPGEHLVRDVAIRLLDVCDADVRQRHIDVQIALSRVGHLSFSFLS